MGMTCVKSDTYAESASDAATLHATALFPVSANPMTMHTRFTPQSATALGSPGTSAAITMERPDAPPSAKLFGAVNST